MQQNEQSDEEQLIAEALGDNSKAGELRAMRTALEGRRDRFRSELSRATTDTERSATESKIKVLDRQIEALFQEEGISEFVETSVRVTLSKGAIDDDDEE